MALESSGSNPVCFANIKRAKFNRAPGPAAPSSELGGKQGQTGTGRDRQGQGGTAEAGEDRRGQAGTVEDRQGQAGAGWGE